MVDGMSGDLFSESLLPRLNEVRRHRLHFYTDYSGFECPRWAWESVEDALDVGVEPPPPRAVWHRTCDFGTTQSEMCVAMHKEKGKGCHLQNILDRLEATATDYIEAVLPDAKAPNEEKAEAHAHIGDWLIENKEIAFPEFHEAESKCAACGTRCPVWPQQRFKNPEDEGLFINVSGVTCVAWSMRGKKTGAAHPSEIPFHVWVAERLYLYEIDKEDIACIFSSTSECDK